jgi:hypothetical protein
LVANLVGGVVAFALAHSEDRVPRSVAPIALRLAVIQSHTVALGVSCLVRSAPVEDKRNAVGDVGGLAH